MLPMARDEYLADFGAADRVTVHFFELKIESANVFRLPSRVDDAGVPDMPGKENAKGNEKPATEDVDQRTQGHEKNGDESPRKPIQPSAHGKAICQLTCLASMVAAEISIYGCLVCGAVESN